jgi:Na+-transporting NADH:ubiquinone oxidoreductase subunit NqrD
VGSLHLLYFEPGETLGPSGPGSGAVLTVLSFLKGLLGSGRFGVLGAWWEKSEGAAVTGLHLFVASPLSSFLLFWACFCCCPSTFVPNSCIVGVVAI